LGNYSRPVLEASPFYEYAFYFITPPTFALQVCSALSVNRCRPRSGLKIDVSAHALSRRSLCWQVLSYKLGPGLFVLLGEQIPIWTMEILGLLAQWQVGSPHLIFF